MTDESTNPTPEQPASPTPPAPPVPPAPPAPPSGGYAPPQAPQAPQMVNQGDKQKVIAGILAILLGSLGVHKFYLGYNKEGIIMLAVTIVGSCIAIGPMVMGVIGIVEGIMYLMKTDEEFYATYVAGQKTWF